MGAFVHCPSCGAPAQGHFCEYCGTPLFTTADAVIGIRGKRCHIWYENEDSSIVCFDMFVTEAEAFDENTTLYADSIPYMSFTSRSELKMRGELADFDMADWAKVTDWQAERWSNRKEK